MLCAPGHTRAMENKRKLKKGWKQNKWVRGAFGLAIGVVNGFFGSAGGIFAVQTMQKMGLEGKKSHATSILAILPMSIASGIIYFLGGHIAFDGRTWMLLGGACAGGLIGALLLGKLKGALVDAIFTLLILASGVRMLF